MSEHLPTVSYPPTVSITKGVVGGEPCVGGSRITVAAVVGLAEKRGLTSEDIAELYPDLTLDEIEWALVFDATYTRRRKRKRTPKEGTGT